MTKLSLIFLFLFTLTTFGATAKDGYVVKGKVYIPKRSISLIERTEKGLVTLGTCEITNGKFLFEGVVDGKKDTYVDYGVLPSQINVTLENHSYKLTSNLLDRDNGVCEQTSKTLGRGYVVEGEVVLPPVPAYLCALDGQSVDTLASCMMVNGEFKFKGVVDTPKIAYIDYGISYAQIYMMLENANYEITSDALNKMNNSYKADSEEQRIYNIFLKNDSTYLTMRRNLSEEFSQARLNNDDKAYKQVGVKHKHTYVEQRSEEDAIIKQYPNSLAALYAVYKWKSDINGEELAVRFKLLGDKHIHLNIYKELQTNIKAVANSTIGRVVPNFTMENIHGKKISLYDIRGKIKVIDFGASWCAPCRALNPIMLDLYNIYNKKGFEIIGVSLDEKREDWVKSVEKDKLPWVQISDLKGWRTSIATHFNVGGIPFLVVLDGENRILAVDANETQLEELLKSVCDEKK